MRPTLRILAVTAIAALTACSHEPTGVLTEQDALDAAARFQSLANDAYNAGADPDVVGAYRDVASAVLRNGRISAVTIVIDGVATEFLATARQMEIDGGPACSQPGSLCLMAAPLRSVIAWQRSDPRRVVQLTATAGATAIGPAVPVLVDASVTIASLIYFDGAGGVYAGTSGTQRIDDPVQSDTPCYTGPPVPTASAMAMLAQCTRAEFTASFNGVLAPSPIPARHNTATGTHTITMASQSIHGARLVLPAAAYPCIVCYGLPRELMPPPSRCVSAARPPGRRQCSSTVASSSTSASASRTAPSCGYGAPTRRSPPRSRRARSPPGRPSRTPRAGRRRRRATSSPKVGSPARRIAHGP